MLYVVIVSDEAVAAAIWNVLVCYNTGLWIHDYILIKKFGKK